jgi:hypothetical protein
VKEKERPSYHTYEFEKKRKHDPKWREEYLQRKEEHTVAFMIKIFWFLVGLNVVIWTYGFYKHF